MEFCSAPGVVAYLDSKKHPNHTINLPCILSRHSTTTRTSFEEHRAIFNQIKLTSPSILPTTTTIISPPFILLPIARTTISTPTKPTTPAHIGDLRNKPYYAEWKKSFI